MTGSIPKCFLLLTLLVSCIHAFSTHQSPFGISSQSHRTQLNLFFGNKQQIKQTPTGSAAKNKSSKKAVKDEAKKPFVFLYGRPMYDWVNNRPMTDQQMEQAKPFDWNAAPNTRSKK